MEIPYDSFGGLKSLPVLSGRDVPYVTARMLPSPFPFLTYFTFLSIHLWVSQLSVFLSNTTLIFKNLQKSRKCKNMNSTERKGIDASVSKVSLPISKNTLPDFILWKKLWPSAQIRTQISWYLHCWNSTKLTMWNIQLTALLLRSSGTCWDHSKDSQSAKALRIWYRKALSLKSIFKAGLSAKHERVGRTQHRCIHASHYIYI